VRGDLGEEGREEGRADVRWVPPSFPSDTKNLAA
jgi:hypothetical protein